MVIKKFKKTVIGLLNNKEREEAMKDIEQMMKRGNKGLQSITSGYFGVYRAEVFEDDKQKDYFFEVNRQVATIIISVPKKKRKKKKAKEMKKKK